jgi:hypothetical protein
MHHSWLLAGMSALILSVILVEPLHLCLSSKPAIAHVQLKQEQAVEL